MKVYELARGVRYEGSSVIAIYGSLEGAIEGAWKEAESQKRIYPDLEWNMQEEKKCVFYINSNYDDYIYIKEHELL